MKNTIDKLLNMKTYEGMRRVAKGMKKELRENKPIITCPVCPNSGCPLKKEILESEAEEE